MVAKRKAKGRRGGGRPKKNGFGAAAQAVVVKALAKGASVAGAAKAAGFCPQTLYTHRGTCAPFRDAWAAAVEESGRPMVVASFGHRTWQVQRARRNRFTLERKQIFCEHFAVTCNAKASADVAGVSKSTVFEHRRTDPAFAAAWQEALEAGYALLEAEAVRQRLEAMEAISFGVGKELTPEQARAFGEDFDRTLCLLREYKRTLTGNPKAGRPPTKWSFDDAFEALEKELKVFGLRIARGERCQEDD